MIHRNTYENLKIYVNDWIFIVKKISYFLHKIYYFPYITTLWILPFFSFLMMSKEGESVCLCSVLQLFQVIQLQNKGGDIQDRGSFIEQTLSKGYGLSSSKRERLRIRFPSKIWLSFDDNKLTSHKKINQGGKRWRLRMKTSSV